MVFGTLRAQSSDATINRLHETYTLNADGSVDYNQHKEIRFNTQYAFFRLFGETFVVYNPEHQKLKINECYTVQSDGTRISLPANALNEVLPAAAANAPAYNGLREMVITHTWLETGATVYLDYTLSTEAGFYPSLDIDKILPVQGADIKEYRITVNVPHGTQLRWSLAGSKVRPRQSGDSYTWTFRNIPVASGESYTPRNANGLPRLSVSTAASLSASLTPLTVETMDICRVPADILKEARTDEQKIAAIQRFIVKNIDNCGVTPDLTGYRIRQCREVMRTAYGTEAEKAFAFAKLLRSEDLGADVVLRFPENTEVRNLKNISGYLVRCNGRYYSPLSLGEVNISLRADRDILRPCRPQNRDRDKGRENRIRGRCSHYSRHHNDRSHARRTYGNRQKHHCFAPEQNTQNGRLRHICLADLCGRCGFLAHDSARLLAQGKFRDSLFG